MQRVARDKLDNPTGTNPNNLENVCLAFALPLAKRCTIFVKI